MRRLLAALAIAALAPAASATEADVQLREVLEQIAAGRTGQALEAVDRLIGQHPNFRLAHLVRGDVLLARTRALGGVGDTGHARGERLEELRAEAAARLRAYHAPPPADGVPAFVLQLAPTQTHAVVVDASRWRVFLFENANGVPRLVEDYYTTLGKNGIDKLREGDRKTPLGVYRVTSMIPGAKLPDLYGWGALPIDYPNEWDRIAGRTGYGIWLHGVPSDTYARAPWASDGCVALANPDIERLAKRVRPGVTPVIIAERVEWLDEDAWRRERARFLERLEAWRSDWESLDAERYLAHYAPSFRSGPMDLGAWSAHKRRVNAGKKWIKVRLENLSVLRSAARGGPVAVTFDQEYRSSNLSQRTLKRQYWIEQDGTWKIAYEGPVRGAAVALPESFPRGSR
ncbi:MAG: L,D-transpeptidase family protein [Betaproteobacteria bacterium]